MATLAAGFGELGNWPGLEASMAAKMRGHTAKLPLLSSSRTGLGKGRKAAWECRCVLASSYRVLCRTDATPPRPGICFRCGGSYRCYPTCAVFSSVPPHARPSFSSTPTAIVLLTLASTIPLLASCSADPKPPTASPQAAMSPSPARPNPRPKTNPP